METVDVKLPSALLRAANLEESSLSEEAARLLALELYREDKVSLGRAAELAYGQNSRRARCPTHELLNFTSIAGS
jgi:predicted HTH domain antitoxin